MSDSLDTQVTNQKFITSQTEWNSFKASYDSTEARDIKVQIVQVLIDANYANQYIRGSFLDIHEIDIPFAESDIDRFDEERTILRDFSSNIHQEIFELVDEPFITSVDAVVSALEGITKNQVLHDKTGLADKMGGIISSQEDRDIFAGTIEDIVVAETGDYEYEFEVEIDPVTGEIDTSRIGLKGLDEYQVSDFVGVVKYLNEAFLDNKSAWKFIKDGWQFEATKFGNGCKIKMIPVKTNGQRTVIVDAEKTLKNYSNWDPSAITSRGVKIKANDIDNLDDGFKGLKDYAKMAAEVGSSQKAIVAKAAKNGFWDGFVPFKSAAEDIGKGHKISGALGLVGDALTIIEDAKDNLYNEEAGKIEITAAGLQRTVTDVGIDFAIGGGTSAICAAVGTAIAPPLGTVVGFAVGMGIDYLVNSVEVDADGDGVKRSASDALKDGADALVDGMVGFAKRFI